MKKIFLTVLALTMFSTSAFAFSFFKKTQASVETVPMFSSETKAENRVWAGTFQLVWNDLMDNIVGGPVTFTNGASKLADELNKQDFKADMLSENSYYTAHGIMTVDLKKTIENALKEKFNEKSDILDGMSWNGRDFLVYAMLKKDFEFMNAFKELKSETFGKSKAKVKYFGIDEEKNQALRDSVSVLFYNSDKDFAVKIYTKSDDKVILYRNNDKSSFEKIYNDVLSKSEKYNGSRHFNSKDKLKVPFIDFKTKHFYNELANKSIKGTDFTISEAMQTVDFKMDNKGVKLKSEAAMIMKMSMLHPEIEEPRNFYFDDTFVLFLIEKNKPYFALRVADVNSLNK